MIYFVVTQRDEDGEWELFGPYNYIDPADTKIAELTDDPKYSQVELARVLTDEDNPDKSQWAGMDVSKLTDNEIREANMTQFLCKKCSFVCDEQWLEEHEHLCIVCYTGGESNDRY